MRRPLTVLALAVLGAGCCPLHGVGMRAVTLRPQETNNWCWAASTEMPIEALGGSVAQCDMANRRFNRTDCCAGTCPQPAACNQPGWPMFTEFGYSHTDSGTPLTFAAIKSQICSANKPMAYAYGPKSGGVGHVVVIYGFIEDSTGQWLMIRDPWAPCSGTTRNLSYAEYSASATTDHWQTSYDITKIP